MCDFRRFPILVLIMCTGCFPPVDPGNQNGGDNDNGNPTLDDLPEVSLRLVHGGLTAPIAAVAPGDGSGRLFIVSQTGAVRIMDSNEDLLDTPFLDISDRLVDLNDAYDERGLLGLAFHPQFATNGEFFVYYSAAPGSDIDPSFDSEVRISRFKVSDDPSIADASSEEILLRVGQPQFNHNGGQLAFGPDGYLYAGLGDGGGANDNENGHTPGMGNGQDLSNLLGKIIRLDVNSDSLIPDNNPFIDRAGARSEIFAYGLRNPWRFSFDDETGRLFCGDVGQNRLEEIDLIVAGANYGWRIREGNECFDPEAADTPPANCASTGQDGEELVAPILEYAHDESGISVVGGFVYRGSAIPGLEGAYVFGDFSSSFTAPSGRLFVAIEGDDGNWSMTDLIISAQGDGLLTDFLYALGRDEAGELYVLTNGSLGTAIGTGAIYKLEN